MDRRFFEIKSFDEKTGEFEGRASVYNVTDLYGDVVKPGAFKRTLDHSGGEYPLLWQHNSAEPIGVCNLHDSPDALMLKGKINQEVQRGREAYALLKQKAVKGLSIGYDTIQDVMEGGVRMLKELALWEVSVVTFPACPPATVTAVKSLSAATALLLASKDIPEGLREKIKGRVARHYGANPVAPWESDGSIDSAASVLIVNAESVKASGKRFDPELVKYAIKSLEALVAELPSGTDSGNHSEPDGVKAQPADDDELKMLSELLSIMAKK